MSGTKPGVSTVLAPVETLRVGRLFEQRAALFVAPHVVAALCGLAVRAAFPAWQLALWLGALFVVATGFLFFIRYHSRAASRSARTPAQWEDLFSLWVFASSVLWGAGALAFFPAGLPLQQVSLAFAIGVLLAVATAVYAASSKSMNAALVPLVSMVVIRLGLEGTEAHYLMALLAALLAGSIAILGHRMHQAICHAIALRCEKDALFLANVHASRLAAVGELASGVGHEVNNPLMVIGGFATRTLELAREGSLTMEMAATHMETIERCTLRIADLIRGMMLFAREGNRDTHQPVTIAAILEQTQSLARRKLMKQGAKLHVSEVPKDVHVLCNSSQLCQALLNVLGNSLEAIVDIEDKWIRIDVSRSGDAVEVAVTDAGTRTEKNPETWFQPFYTTKDAAHVRGLGLSIVRGILDTHRGTVHVDVASSNTRVVLRFPIASLEAAPEAKAA